MILGSPCILEDIKFSLLVKADWIRLGVSIGVCSKVTGLEYLLSSLENSLVMWGIEMLEFSLMTDSMADSSLCSSIWNSVVGRSLADW